MPGHAVTWERLLDSMNCGRALRGEIKALFGFNARSLQEWGQCRRHPEIPIRVYLAVIQRDPQAVIRAPAGRLDHMLNGELGPREFRNIRASFSSS